MKHKPSSGTRVLGRLRLSVTSDESTSIERQREIIEQWADANGYTVVGWAEDVDVSGTVDPFDTPRLGDWLNNRAPEFDVISVWKLDRLSRNSIKLNKIFGWCIDHDKTVVSCSESIDLGTPVGRLIANVIGFLAEGELEAMRERQISSRRKLRETARWPGGKPPYGYRVIDKGFGKGLEIDPHAHRVVRRIVDQLIDGVSLNRICGDLNRDGVVSPSDHHRVVNGEEDSMSPWRTWPMKHLLTSPTLVGYAHLGGVTTRDDNGDPVLMCDTPLVTADERELIADALASAEGRPRVRGVAAALVGLASCWFCETNLTMSSQAKTMARGNRVVYSYYRCPKNCTPLIPAETAEAHAEMSILDALGDEDVTERVWVSGDYNDDEMRAAVEAVDELSAAFATAKSKTARERLHKQLATQDARIAELEAAGSREGHYEERPTGQTYRQAWDGAPDPDSRRALMQRIGVGLRMGIVDGNLLSHPTRLGDR